MFHHRSIDNFIIIIVFRRREETRGSERYSVRETRIRMWNQPDHKIYLRKENPPSLPPPRGTILDT